MDCSGQKTECADDENKNSFLNKQLETSNEGRLFFLLVESIYFVKKKKTYIDQVQL